MNEQQADNLTARVEQLELLVSALCNTFEEVLSLVGNDRVERERRRLAELDAEDEVSEVPKGPASEC